MTSKWTAADIPDQTGRTVLITGANSGLGLRSAEALAAKGARVLLGCRNATKAAAALRNLAGSEQLTDVVFVGDLAAHQVADGTVDVAVRTVKPLDERSRAVLVERAEHALGVPRRGSR